MSREVRARFLHSLRGRSHLHQSKSKSELMDSLPAAIVCPRTHAIGGLFSRVSSFNEQGSCERGVPER
jgi:hypothetical protein